MYNYWTILFLPANCNIKGCTLQPKPNLAGAALDQAAVHGLGWHSLIVS